MMFEILTLVYCKENKESGMLCINFLEFFFLTCIIGEKTISFWRKKHLTAFRNRKICEIRETAENI